MQEILEYVSKVTLGLLQPSCCVWDYIPEMLDYTVDRLVTLIVDSVPVAEVKLANAELIYGSDIYICWHFDAVPGEIIQLIRNVRKTQSVLQIAVDNEPATTQSGDDVWHVRPSGSKAYRQLTVCADCLELQDPRLRDLCEKFLRK